MSFHIHIASSSWIQDHHTLLLCTPAAIRAIGATSRPTRRYCRIHPFPLLLQALLVVHQDLFGMRRSSRLHGNEGISPGFSLSGNRRSDIVSADRIKMHPFTCDRVDKYRGGNGAPLGLLIVELAGYGMSIFPKLLFFF